MADKETQSELNSLVKSTFNNSEFVFEISIANSAGNLFQKFANGEVLKLTIERDITKYYDTGVILIKDLSNFYSILANGTGQWFLSINIIQSESLQNVPDAIYKKTFLITSVGIESVMADYSKVKITFADSISQIFNRNISYSSQSDSDVSSVVCGMLESIGFKSGATNYTGLPEIENCGQSLNYITDTTTAAINHIDNVLSQIYSDEKGFLFLYYNKKLEPIWTKNILSGSIDLNDEETKYKNSAYFLNVQSSNFPDRNTNIVVEFFPYNNILPYENSTRLIYPTYIQNFNYTTSRVEVSKDDTWDIDKFKKLFILENEDNVLMPGFLEDPTTLAVENINFFETAPEYAVGNFYRKSNADNFYRDLRNYFIYNNLISFKVQGQIWRNPGQLYHILYDQSPNTKKIAGNWFCTKIVNLFESEQFYQYVFLTRLADYVDENESDAYRAQLQNEIDTKEYIQ